MTASVTPTTVQSSSTEVQETAERRKARIEIIRLDEAVNQSSQTDDLTCALKESITSYREEVCKSTCAHPERWMEELIQLFQVALTDDLYGIPYSSPYLGSDGGIYDEKVLYLHALHCKREELDRSPLTGEATFTVEPHQAAKACVEWLQKQGVFTPNPVIEAQYDKIDEQGLVIPLPTVQNAGRRLPFWEMAQEGFAQYAMLERIDHEVDALPAQFRNALDQIDDECAAACQEVLEAFERAMCADAEEFARRYAELDAQIAAVEAGKRELEERCERLETNISMAKEEIQELNRAIHACAEAIAAVRKKSRRRLLMQCVSFAVNAVVTFATGGSFLGAVCLQAKRAAVQIAASSWIKNPLVASMVAGGVNSSSEAFFSDKLSAVTEGVKGAALPVFDAGIKASGAPPVVGGAVGGFVRTTVSSQGAATSLDRTKNVILGGIGGVVSHETDVSVTLSSNKGKYGLNLQP